MFNNNNNRTLIYDSVYYKLYCELDGVVSLVKKSNNNYHVFSDEDGNYILEKLRADQISEVDDLLSIYEPYFNVPVENGHELEEKYLLDI